MIGKAKNKKEKIKYTSTLSTLFIPDSKPEGFKRL
ncbi:MAG: hypothetical protein ACJAUJ_000097 [Salibacteraceae bacterium]